jgi:outer membrane protein assembly factor BamD
MFLPIRRAVIHLAVLVALPGLLACGPTVKTKLPNTYTGNAQRAYELGMIALQKSNYAEASGYFQTVKRRFPYSVPWAVLAQLRLADVSFQREAYLEAVDAYKQFIKFYPTNDNVPYAQYQIAKSHFLLGPDEWVILPPSHEKDLSAVLDALKEVRIFLKKYPGSGLLGRAKKLLAQCEKKLSDFELYVANYYFDRDKLAGAIMRLEYILEKYPTMATDEEVLYLLGRVYARMGRHEKAVTVFQKLATEKPKGKYQKKVAEYLRKRPTK